MSVCVRAYVGIPIALTYRPTSISFLGLFAKIIKLLLALFDLLDFMF